MKLIVAPVPNRPSITLEGETTVIQKAVRVKDSPYYRRHIEAGDLAEVSDLDEEPEPEVPTSGSVVEGSNEGTVGGPDATVGAGSEDGDK